MPRSHPPGGMSRTLFGGRAGSPRPPHSVISTQSAHLTLGGGTGQRAGVRGRGAGLDRKRPPVGGRKHGGASAHPRPVVWTKRARRRRPSGSSLHVWVAPVPRGPCVSLMTWGRRPPQDIVGAAWQPLVLWKDSSVCPPKGTAALGRREKGRGRSRWKEQGRKQTAKPTLTRRRGSPVPPGRGALSPRWLGGRRWQADRTPGSRVLRPTCKKACPRRKAQWRALNREQGGPGSGPALPPGHQDLWQSPAPC